MRHGNRNSAGIISLNTQRTRAQQKAPWCARWALASLKLTRATNAEQSVLRLEWMSRVDSFDLLQTQDQLQRGGWTDVEQFSGTGEVLSKDITSLGASGFYRLHRELR
jgi:hypothetical protein